LEQQECFADHFRDSAGHGATFDMSNLRYASSDPGGVKYIEQYHLLHSISLLHSICYNREEQIIHQNMLLILSNVISQCPREVVTRQHDRLGCIFIEELTGAQVAAPTARIVALDAVECVMPDLQGLMTARAVATATATGEIANDASIVVHLEVTLDGQTRFVREGKLGVLSPLQFLAYDPPRISHIIPDTGPVTETTEVTIHGVNFMPPNLDARIYGPMNVLPEHGGWGWGGARGAQGGVDASGMPIPPGGHFGRASADSQQLRCLFEASSGPHASLELRQATTRRMAATIKLVSDRVIICRAPRIWRSLADGSEQGGSQQLRRLWIFNISVSLNGGRNVSLAPLLEPKSLHCAQTPLQHALSMREADPNYRSASTCGTFRYVPMWQVTSLVPTFGPESGGTLVTVEGVHFVERAHTRAACRFWGDQPSALEVHTSNTKTLADSTPAMLTCAAPTVYLPRPQTLVRDEALDLCLLQRPYDPACPRSAMPCNGLLAPAGTSRTDYLAGYRRGLCLPPAFSCAWNLYDDTTSALVCQLPDASYSYAAAFPDEATSDSQVLHVRSVPFCLLASCARSSSMLHLYV
jgi:hypothetical protein